MESATSDEIEKVKSIIVKRSLEVDLVWRGSSFLTLLSATCLFLVQPREVQPKGPIAATSAAVLDGAL